MVSPFKSFFFYFVRCEGTWRRAAYAGILPRSFPVEKKSLLKRNSENRTQKTEAQKTEVQKPKKKGVIRRILL